jgi:hypothetical protein
VEAAIALLVFWPVLGPRSSVTSNSAPSGTSGPQSGGQPKPSPTPTRRPTATPVVYYSGRSLLECRDAWEFLYHGEGTDSEKAQEAQELVEYLYAYIFRDPESFGYIMKDCIDGGWDEWESIPPPPPFR